MARIKEEDLRLNIIINSDGKTKLSQLEKQTKMNTMSLSELQKHLKLTNTALSKAVPGTQNWKNLQAEVQRTRNRLSELKNGGASVSDSINKFINGIGGKFALGTLAVQGFNAVLNLGKKAIEDMKTQTQAWGDAWKITVAGLNAGWNQLIANMSAGTGTIKRSIGEAVAAAREAAALRDELFERRNSLAIEEEIAQQYINEQNAIAMDSSRSAHERVKALDMVMSKEEELAKLRTDIASQSLEAARLELTGRTSLEDEDLQQMIILYNQNRNFIKQGEEYNNLLKTRELLSKSLSRSSATRGVAGVNAVQNRSQIESELNEVNAKIAEASDETIKFASIVRQYNLSNDELVKNYVEGVKEVEHAETELTSARQGQARRRGALNNQIASEAKAATEKEYADKLQVITAANNAELLEVKRNFAEKTISEQAYKEKSEELEARLLSQKIELNRRYGKDTLELENELQNKILENELAAQQLRKDAVAFVASLETDKTEIARAAEEKRYEEEKKAFEKYKSAIEDQDAVLERMELQHQNNLRKINLDAFDQRFELLKKQHKVELLQIQNDAGKEKLSVKNGSTAEKLIDEKAAVAVANLEISYLEKYLKELEALDKSGLKEDEVAEIRLKIQQATQELNAAREIINGDKEGAFSGTGSGSLFGVSEGQWETLFGHLKDGKFAAEDLQTAIAAVGGAAQEAFKLVSQAIELTNAKENQEFKDYQNTNNKKRKELEDRLRVGLITQAQYDRAIADMQEKEDAKQEELQAAQAERQKKAAIAQATIQAALAVAKTFAEWGGWPFGVAPAAIMAALGAAQVAMIAATPTGYAEGGEVTRAQDGRKFNAHLSPSKRGFISSPTILVGEEGGEYVIPADGLRNPSLAPFIGSIEAARRAGTLRNINFGAVSPVMSSVVPAMASGGSTTPISIPAADYTAILEGMRELGRKMENVRAVVPMLGKGGIAEALDDYDKIKRRGRL